MGFQESTEGMEMMGKTEKMVGIIDLFLTSFKYF